MSNSQRDDLDPRRDVDAVALLDRVAGDAGDNILSGTTDADELIGRGGNDTLRGHDGDDRLRSGGGDDVAYGGAGDDLVFGHGGNDILWGDGDEYIVGQWQSWGRGGNDELRGGPGDDQLNYAVGGHDRLLGQGGHDTFRIHAHEFGYYDSTVLAMGGGGDDTLVTVREPQAQVASTRGLDIRFFGQAGRDTARLLHTGWDSRIELDMGDAADTVELGSYAGDGLGTFVISLGAGADSLTIDGKPARVILRDFDSTDDTVRIELKHQLGDWDGTTNPFATGHAFLVQKGDKLHLMIDEDGRTGAANAVRWLTFFGTTEADLDADMFYGWATDGSEALGLDVRGTAGDDVLAGGRGDDLIYGYAGDDTLDGDAGDDLIYGGSGNDDIEGGGGNDLVFGGDGDDRLSYRGGFDTLNGQGGDDILVTSGGWSGSGRAIFHGKAGEDAFYLHAGGDLEIRAYGGADNDTIWFYGSESPGSTSPVLIDAGDGDDKVYVTSASVVRATDPINVTLGAGSDTLRVDVPTTQLTVTDFQAGVGGDIFDLSQFGYYMEFAVGFAHPVADVDQFRRGYLKLEQVDDDAVLYLDINGGGDDFVEWVVFADTQAADFTALNFSGEDPHETGTDRQAEMLADTATTRDVPEIGGSAIVTQDDDGFWMIA